MLSTVFTVAGGILAVIGGIMILIAAFKESILWGLGSLLIPLVALIFVFTHWQQGKTGFLWSIAGWVVIGIGVALAPEVTTNAMM